MKNPNKLYFDRIDNDSNKNMVGKLPSDKDCGEPIYEPSLIYTDGVPTLLYLPIQVKKTRAWGKALNSLKYQKRKRIGGLAEKSAYMGSYPRTGFRSKHCNLATLNEDHPELYNQMIKLAEKACKRYGKLFNETFNKHLDMIKVGWKDKEPIHDDYIIGDSVFTGLVINKNTQMAYHLDRGNHPDVFSALFTFKNDCVGGHLAFPEYGFSIAMEDGALLLFNGQKIIHGVTPIKPISKNAYRYSVVFYSKTEMWKCLPLDEELLKAQKDEFEKTIRDAKSNNDKSTDVS